MLASWIENIYCILGQMDLLWPESYVGLKSYFLHPKFLLSYQAVSQEVCPKWPRTRLMLIIETLKGF